MNAVPRRSSLHGVTEGARDLAPSPEHSEAPVAGSPPRPLRLGNIEIDFERYVLRVGGRLVPLTYFQFICLGVLARRRETVVLREELCRALWGDHTHDHNLRLNSQMSSLRHRLRGSEPWTIRTVHQRGYILTADG